MNAKKLCACVDNLLIKHPFGVTMMHIVGQSTKELGITDSNYIKARLVIENYINDQMKAGVFKRDRSVIMLQKEVV